MRMFLFFTAAVALPIGAASAWPQLDGPADPYGARAIVRGAEGDVTAKMSRAVARGDRTPELLLNLATIYARQSRAADAGSLYRMVLDQPNVDLTTIDGTAWSHDLARRGLQRTALLASR